jgi:transcription initiation factor TFIIIB Brf1 subunit/transcription initiation factor TFIIB
MNPRPEIPKSEKCPKCGSTNIVIEKRIDGDMLCFDCGAQSPRLNTPETGSDEFDKFAAFVQGDEIESSPESVERMKNTIDVLLKRADETGSELEFQKEAEEAGYKEAKLWISISEDERERHIESFVEGALWARSRKEVGLSEVEVKRINELREAVAKRVRIGWMDTSLEFLVGIIDRITGGK